MAIAGEKLDLEKVKVPVYNLATREDHIAPAKSVFVGSQFFGGPVRFVLAGSGHIAGVVNPPAQEEVPVLDRRRRRPANLDDWLAKATEHPGSWWPDWLEWIEDAGRARGAGAQARRRQAASRSRTRPAAT